MFHLKLSYRRLVSASYFGSERSVYGHRTAWPGRTEARPSAQPQYRQAWTTLTVITGTEAVPGLDSSVCRVSSPLMPSRLRPSAPDPDEPHGSLSARFRRNTLFDAWGKVLHDFYID